MLILPIKKKYFDMIKNREKLEEYREIKPYWTKRFLNNLRKRSTNRIVFTERDVPYAIYNVCFRNGYSKKSPKINCKIFLKIGQGKEEWGAEKGKEYYILEILEILEVIK